MTFKKKDRPLTRRSPTGKTETEDAVLYGVHTVVEALKNPARRLERLYISDNARRHLNDISLPPSLEVIPAAPGEITKRAPEDAVHQGLLAFGAPLPDADLSTIPLNGPILILDQVTDPHNVGAIVRTAATFGVSCLVTTRRYSPSATGVLAKSASGGLEHVPWARETNLARAIETLQDRFVTVVGLDGSVETALGPMTEEAPYALVLGAEGKGMRQKTAATCNRLARIPLPGKIVSLNVSNACAIALTISSGLGQG